MLENLLWVIGMVGIFRTLIYAIGEPHDTFNPKAILSGYTAILAEMRLAYLNILDRPIISIGDKKEDKILNKEMHDGYVVDRVKRVAGPLNAIGYCPTCTSVWFMAFAVLIPTGSFALYGVSLLLSKIAFKWI